MDSTNEINNDIKFLAKSEIRLKILSELYKNPNNVKGIIKKTRSEEHTSELQSLIDLVCRLLLEKKK